MAYILFDFRCNTASCYTKFEDLVPSDVLVSICPECGGQAKRLISAPRMDPRMGVDPNSSMADKWARNLQKRYEHAKKMKREHGDEI